MITIAKLMERDKGICYHCGNSVDATAKTPMSRAPTIDHFIPVSKKGLHKWDNVVLACFDCNVDKSDSMPSKDGQQLMFAV
jgi:5-methylcytosine-specific restriction endonuclease McrA